MDLTSDTPHWHSTYGLLTAERLLANVQISLPRNILASSLGNADSFISYALMVPFKLVYIGIVLQHCVDYQSYIQKRYIDYYLSNESDKMDDTPGAEGRENLLIIKEEFQTLESSFEREKKFYELTIATVQKKFMDAMQLFLKHLDISSMVLSSFGDHKLDNAIFKQHFLAYLSMCSLKDTHSQKEEGNTFTHFVNQLRVLVEQQDMFHETLNREKQELFEVCIDNMHTVYAHHENAVELLNTFKHFRNDLYQIALKLASCLQSLPDYQFNQEKDIANRELLLFDRHIG